MRLAQWRESNYFFLSRESYSHKRCSSRNTSPSYDVRMFEAESDLFGGESAPTISSSPNFQFQINYKLAKTFLRTVRKKSGGVQKYKLWNLSGDIGNFLRKIGRVLSLMKIMSIK